MDFTTTISRTDGARSPKRQAPHRRALDESGVATNRAAQGIQASWYSMRQTAIRLMA